MDRAPRYNNKSLTPSGPFLSCSSPLGAIQQSLADDLEIGHFALECFFREVSEE